MEANNNGANTNAIAKESSINIKVGLNHEKHPVSIKWLAEDAGLDDQKDAKSMMLALWDKKEKSTMRIDLWTLEMSVEEMQFFMYEMLASMADTYERSTSDHENATSIRNFSKEFGKKTKVIK